MEVPELLKTNKYINKESNENNKKFYLKKSFNQIYQKHSTKFYG